MLYPLHVVRQLFASLWKKASRKGLRTLMYFSPDQKKLTAERWLRGREQFRKLRLADIVVVSFGKSGRTWLRVMLSRIYQQRYNLPARDLLGFDNLHHKNREIPRIFFTHDNYIKDYTGHHDSKMDFYDKKVILLVRDPRDVAVSQFFQWKYRMRPAKKDLNQYPGEGEEVSPFDFLMNPDAGLPKIIKFMNQWANEIPRMQGITLVRYEDLKMHPEQTLKAVFDFIGTPATEPHIKEAVAFASYDNMKQMEQKQVFWLSGGRLVPRDRENPNSFKVRRAKVAGYRDYFDDQQVARIDELVASTLSPVFGYGNEHDRRVPSPNNAAMSL